jgi:Tol biopolymer transport system component
MARPSIEILALARAELARGRPRVALKELEAARAELLAASDVAGLGEALELALKVPTLAPVDTRSRERLLATIARDITSIAPGRTAPAAAPSAPAAAPALYVSFASTQREQILAPVRAEIEREATGRALRRLEKARRKLLDRGDVAGLGELLDLAQRMPTAKARHEKARRELIGAAQQNVRYLGRRSALKAGEAWSDPFAAAQPKAARKLPSLPPMSRREILIAAAIVCAIVGVIAAWALVNRAPQRVAHAINCPTGEQGGPTWSPDGKQIAFAKNGDCGTQIMTVSVASDRVSPVTRRYGVLPSWSPDGQTILYRSSSGFSLVSAGGGEPLLLRSDDGDMGASWSPNGTRIAFVHGTAVDPATPGDTFSSTMYTMKPNGSSVHRVIGHACNPRTPSWSPSGRYLVFACDRGIYYMPFKGGSLERLIAGTFANEMISVSTSPDARMLAFAEGDIEICTVEGKDDPKTLPGTIYGDDATIDVAWSPDSKQIAYSVTGSEGEDGLYVIDKSGKNRRLLVRF